AWDRLEGAPREVELSLTRERLGEHRLREARQPGRALAAEVEVVLPDERAVRLFDRARSERVGERGRSVGVVLRDERVQCRCVRERMKLDPLVCEVAVDGTVAAREVGAVRW